MITGRHVRFYRTDMRDEEDMRQIFEDNKIDAVIHFAGLKAVGESVEKPLEYYYDLADYTDFNKAYPERMRVFRDFLQRNGLAEAAGG